MACAERGRFPAVLRGARGIVNHCVCAAITRLFSAGARSNALLVLPLGDRETSDAELLDLNLLAQPSCRQSDDRALRLDRQRFWQLCRKRIAHFFTLRAAASHQRGTDHDQPCPFCYPIWYHRFAFRRDASLH
jgi:hypothetical protein